MMSRSGANVKARVLSDYNSGRTDRVVAEWEADTLGELEAVMTETLADPEVQAEFVSWLEKLNELIHYAEAEHWATLA